MRRVLVFVTAAGVIAAVVALSSGGRSPAVAPRLAATFAGSPAWRNMAPPRRLALRARTLSVPLLPGGTCWIASARCSLTPCVDPVATVPGLPPHLQLVSPTKRPAVRPCRRSKPSRRRANSA